MLSMVYQIKFGVDSSGRITISSPESGMNVDPLSPQASLHLARKVIEVHDQIFEREKKYREEKAKASP